MGGENWHFWNLVEQDPTLALLGLYKKGNKCNSMEKLVDFLSKNIVLLENMKNSSNSRKEGLFNFLFLFQKLNVKSVENENPENASLLPLDLKFADSMLEQKTLLEDLVILLVNGEFDVFKKLYSLLIKFNPLDLKDLLSIEKNQGSMICIYFTIYLSILLNVFEYEHIGNLRKEGEIEELKLNWINKFFSQINDLLDYFSNRTGVLNIADINNDFLLLIYALILYLIFSIIDIGNDRKGECKLMIMKLINIQPNNLKFNYWYLKIILIIIEKTDMDFTITELVSIVLHYQKFIGEKFIKAENSDYLEKSMNKLSVFEVHMMTQLCRMWVSKEITLKKQLILFLERSVFAHHEWKKQNLDGYFSKIEDDLSNLDPINILFVKLLNLFCKGFGVSMIGVGNGEDNHLTISDLKKIDSLFLLNLFDELLHGGCSQKINGVILFDSIRMLVTVLTILVDPKNFENENYDIKRDIQSDLLIVKIHKGGWNLKTYECFDLIEKLFLVITVLIIRYKSDHKELNNSIHTISSVSSSSTNSVFKTTTFDISLFLILWNNYVTLIIKKEYKNDQIVLNKSIQLALIYLVNRKYKLDILCEITFSISEYDENLPILLDDRYFDLIDLWISLWRNYLYENPDLFFRKGDEIETIFTVPNINYFFEYLRILDQVVLRNTETPPSQNLVLKDKESNNIQKISKKVLELTGIISSILICHKISHSFDRYNILMAMLSASENPRILSDYIYKQVTNTLQLDGAYIYNCLKFFREIWSSSIKIRVFSLISDLYISLMKQSLFQFIQCLLSNFSVRGGIFDRSFALFKVRGMRGIISDEDFEILQQKLTDISSYSNLSLGGDSISSLIKNEIFFGCYSIDLYYTINNIQKGWQSPSLSISPSSPKTFLNKKRHSSLMITDSEDVYSIINHLNPLFDQLTNDNDYLMLFMNTVGEINKCYFYFLFGNKNNKSGERSLIEQISNFSTVFGVKFEDEKFMASINMENELLKYVNNDDKREKVIEERLNYKFYSQLIIRMIYLCTWMIVDNNYESYRSFSEIFAEKILIGLFGLSNDERFYNNGESDFNIFSPNINQENDHFERFNSSLQDYYVLEHYTKFVCIIWSIISSMDPESIFRIYMKILKRKSLSYYQLYILLVFLIESSDWFIYHGYFQFIDLLKLLKQVELMTSLSSAYLQVEHQDGEKTSQVDSSILHLKILFVSLILKSITIEKSKEVPLEVYKKKHSAISKSNQNDMEISQIKISTFNNKWTQRDAYINGGRSMVNSSYFLSCQVLPYLWSFYENYPTYKDIYTRLLQTSTQLTTYLDNLCVNLYDGRKWQGIMSNFNNTVSETLVDIYDNRLLPYNQYIVLEYIWEYYINGNTMLLIEKYISALTFSIYSLKKVGFFEVWLILSFWKKYPTRIYKHMMKVNTTWIVSFLMDHLIHYSILVRNKSIGISSSRKDSIHIFNNIEFENTFSFLLYHYHPQHYHDRMSGKYFWYNANSEQGYLNKINSHAEIKSLVVNCRYNHGNYLSLFQFHDYLHYIGHLLPFSVVIYLLSNQFSSEKKKFISNSHHFHHYFHHNLYTNTLIVWSCVRSLLLFQESEWELLLLQYMEIIKSNKRNNQLVLTCLLDMALKSTKFSQILCIYTNNPNSPVMNLFQKSLFKECDSLLTYKTLKNRVENIERIEVDEDMNNKYNKINSSEMNDKGVINRLRTVQDSMEGLNLRISSVSSLIYKCLDGISPASDSLNRSSLNLLHIENKQHSIANIQFSFFYILCQLGEMAKYRNRRGGLGSPLEEDEDPSVLIGRLNSKEIAQLKSEIAQDLLMKIESVIQRREYKNVPFLNTNMLKSSQTKTRLLSIKKINKIKILQSAKNIPYLLSLQLTNHNIDDQEENITETKKDYELTVNLIVKCNDDCRQDVITMQYIHVFQKIFEIYNIPVWLYPYRILPMMFKDINNSVIYGGIIEFIEDSISLHEIHELHPEGGLKAYYESTFGCIKDLGDERGRSSYVSYEQARYNFISSLAGYSIACYVLQIKDRHNGNILITKNGHIIHIDYGFIFDISPGNNLHFERAAFKVTQEMLDFMDDQVDLFDDLCLSGFLAVREHADLLLSLTQMLINSGIPCFRGETIKKLKERLLLNFSQQQASNIFSKKIHSAHNHITTKGYDFVQFIQQGIK
ncbi:phosphatidylinositol 4-kinase domain-containing protein [Cryptosporidium ubiquitum]|uniref:Phosphatidylinositol 4-kinase domain-containing protein n=1 Tax=Cryptosporidium ubiquitum TaxID=857276 RepID=A0A1J4MJP9_9CRYT|nr:phosphatidylinositol 4-kinase domain-containing protein [Cryptosporidium ubiquitum]OII73236.1 phosphatidylinositol 4-kinase domain-containing protein [Cryptosporidium ubiquitum]